MMKATIAIVLLIFSLQVLGQSISKNSYWIALESKQLDKHGISPLDVMILNFKENQLEFSHIFFDSIQSVSMNIKKDKIFIEKKLWAKINYINQDSLLLDFDKNMRVKFVPLKRDEKKLNNIDFWQYLDWTFYEDKYSAEIKLTNKLLDMYPNEVAKNCLVFTKWQENHYARNEKWNIKVVNGNHLFAKTYGQFDYEIYKVLSYSGDSILLKNLLTRNESLLIKKTSICVSDYNSILKKIKNFKWKSIELINNSQAFEGDSAFSRFNSSGTHLPDTTFIKMSSIKNNQVSIQFDDNDYKYFVSDTLFDSEKWCLSPTGNEIVLNNGCLQEDYIDLINIGEDTITIGKFDKVQIGSNKRRFVDFYYVLKLIK